MRSHSFGSRVLVIAGAALAAGLAVFLAYHQSLGFELLLWDDARLTVENPLIHLRGIAGLAALFDPRPHLIAGAESEFYPVRDALYALIFMRFRDNPLPYHLANLLLHCAAAALLCLLAQRAGLRPAWALFACLAFALHPLNTEAVCWISETKTMLSAAFLLAAFHAHLSFLRASGAKRLVYYALALGFLCLSVMSKATAVAHFLVFALYDLLIAARTDRLRALVEKIPHAAVSAAMALAIYLSFRHQGAAGEYPGGTFSSAVMTSFLTISKFFVKLFVPYELSARYVTDAVVSPLDPRFAPCVIFVLGLLAAGLLFWKRRPLVAFFVLFFFTQAAPFSNWVPTTMAEADRWLYVHTMCAAILVAACCQKLMDRPGNRGGARLAAAGAAVVLLAAAAALDSKRSWIWRDDRSLWESVLAEHPDLTGAYVNLAEHYARKGDQVRMFEVAERALRLEGGGLEPSALAILHSNLGNFLLRGGNEAEAEAHYRKAFGMRPRSADAAVGLAVIAKRRGSLDETAFFMQAALSREPSSPVVLHNMGALLERLGRDEEALGYYRKAAAASPYFSGAFVSAARLLSSLGRQDEAIGTLEEGLAFNPGDSGLNRAMDELRSGPANQAER